MAQKIVCIVGPTASGKTALGAALALEWGGEVVSADSMQVYRRMNIGTAKPTAEEMRGVPHHMLDVAEPGENYSVARYAAEAARCVEDILSRGKLPLVVGGTGLYVDALASGREFAPPAADPEYRKRLAAEAGEKGGAFLLDRLRERDPDSAARLHENDVKRIIRALEVLQVTGRTITEHNQATRRLPPRYDALTIGLDFASRAELYARIDARVDRMLELGLREEVVNLLASGIPRNCTAMQAIGYKELALAEEGVLSSEEAAARVKQESRRYAKRQLTWFRRDRNIRWIFWEGRPDPERARQISSNYLTEFGIH